MEMQTPQAREIWLNINSNVHLVCTTTLRKIKTADMISTKNQLISFFFVPWAEQLFGHGYSFFWTSHILKNWTHHEWPILRSPVLTKASLHHEWPTLSYPVLAKIFLPYSHFLAKENQAACTTRKVAVKTKCGLYSQQVHDVEFLVKEIM